MKQMIARNNVYGKKTIKENEILANFQRFDKEDPQQRNGVIDYSSVMCKVCLTVSNTILGADAVDRQNHRTLSNICLYKCTNIRYRGARLVA